jgi:hypothetical protein
MKKGMLIVVLLPLLIIALGGVSQAWQGRMAGMGDPYGLVADPSDFLAHPAKLANGEGIRFYGFYRFTYTDVMDWDVAWEEYDTTGVLNEFFDFDTSGLEYAHNALVGAGFPLGPGRMGLFFSYDGMRGDYDGNEVYWDGGYDFYEYDLNSAIDAFALRLLYGLPLGGFNLGGEVQFAYRQEKNETWFNETDLSYGILNNPLDGFQDEETLFLFMIPYDADYWEALFKGSVEAVLGPLDVEFALRGGFIFSGDNEWIHDVQVGGTSLFGFELDGGVEGWQIGGDLWVRYPIDSLTLPFLVRVDYQEKTRDGDGESFGILPGILYDYEHQERSLQIEVGGGVDKELDKRTGIAAGIYYNYLQGVDDHWKWEDGTVIPFGGIAEADCSNCPAHTEHRAVLKVAGEREISPAIALRIGLGLFYGWVRENFELAYTNVSPFTTYIFSDAISLDGYHWGIGGSFGGTVKFNGFTMEPFFNIGWQAYDLDGDGKRIIPTAGITHLYDMNISRSEWSIGGGLSILFDI